MPVCVYMLLYKVVEIPFIWSGRVDKESPSHFILETHRPQSTQVIFRFLPSFNIAAISSCKVDTRVEKTCVTQET